MDDDEDGYDENSRWFFVDGERMAEGGVEEQPQAMAPALASHGVTLAIERENMPDGVENGDYVLRINGRSCHVWAPDDWRAGQPWHAASVRPLAVVNDLLAAANAVPRLHLLYAGGNEGIAWLLDPKIIVAVQDSGLVEAHETPRLAIHEE